MRLTLVERPLALTQGDPAGIGPDIAISAWLKRKDLGLHPFVYIGDPEVLAARGRHLVQEELDDRRLAGTGGADEEDELTLLDTDADIVQRRPRRLRIRLRHVLELNHGWRVYAV